MESSKRDALVNAMTEAARVHIGHFSDGDKDWICDCGEAGSALDSYVRHVNRAALSAALTAIETEECGECGGLGYVSAHDPGCDGDAGCERGCPVQERCEPCHWSGSVPGKPLIIGAAIEAGIDVVDALVKLGVLVRDGFMLDMIEPGSLDMHRWFCEDDEDAESLAHGWKLYQAQPVYRVTQSEGG